MGCGASTPAVKTTRSIKTNDAVIYDYDYDFDLDDQNVDVPLQNTPRISIVQHPTKTPPSNRTAKQKFNVVSRKASRSTRLPQKQAPASKGNSVMTIQNLDDEVDSYSSPRRQPSRLQKQTPASRANGILMVQSLDDEIDSYPPVPRQTFYQKQPKTPNTMMIQNLDDGDNYPPVPNRLKKSQIVPDVSMFKHIDEHVKNTPRVATASVAELAQYLVRVCRNQLEKIRAHYQWVTKNIDYDVAGYMSGNLPNCAAEVTLRSKRSVCSGYSRLFAALCQETGVPVKRISGFAKGFSQDPLKPYTVSSKTNHEWNAVFISNEWRLIDCTWDAGHTDGKTFTRHEGEFYFLTDPEVFINDHFPYMDNNLSSSLKWQLLAKPVDLNTYSKSVKLLKQGYEYNIELVSHKFSVIKVAKEAIVTLKSRDTPLKGITTTLKEKNGESYKQYTLAEKKASDTYQIKVKPPTTTTYELDIYGNNGEKTYHPLVTYIVECTDVDKNIVPYPSHYGFWGFNDDFADYGFDEGVSKLSTFVAPKGELEVELPVRDMITPLLNLNLAEDTENYKDYVFLEGRRSSIVLKIRLPYAGFYKLILFAKNLAKQSSSNDVVANLLVECKKPCANGYPFPTAYDKAVKYQVHLIEPDCKDIPAQTEMVFKLSSPLLARVMHSTNVMKRPEGSDVWEFTDITPASGKSYCIFGSDKEGGSCDAIFLFKCV